MAQSPLHIEFNLPFADAIAAAAALGVELPEEYYARVPGEARRAATTIAGLASLEQIQAVVDSFATVLSGEKSTDEWVRWALEQGWGLPPARLETIIRTNLQTAYSAGHWIGFEEHKDRRPYLMWSAINDSRVRPAHLAMDGYIAPVDDPIWQVWHPPAGYNCRCSQISLTEKQARDRGYGKQVRPDVEPDPGFGGPGGLLDGLLKAIEKLKAACAAFTFSGTRKEPPVWCMDDGALSLEHIERSLLDSTRLAPPTEIAIAELAVGAAKSAAEHAVLRLGPVANAAKIHQATGLALVEFEHVLDNYGIRHALNQHGNAAIEAVRGQRAITPYDFTLVPAIIADADEVIDAGLTSYSSVPVLLFVKRIGSEVYYYAAEVRNGRRQLATLSMWIRKIR